MKTPFVFLGNKGDVNNSNDCIMINKEVTSFLRIMTAITHGALR